MTSDELKGKRILDACCGGRMFWFDKRNPDVLFVDKRRLAPEKLSNGSTFEVEPDALMDFRELDLPDESFHLVVFDPPHLVRPGETSFMFKKYGGFKPDEWAPALRAGFAECFRVLKPNGVLVFKWNEMHVPLKKVLELTPAKPLFGHKSGKQQKTHWICFIK